ncbi:MAG: choice-of-anchor D domain-containing protein [Methylotenera sp.]|nr:choice-of-anchor D domain-containing protein [Oligoflexia bacterium]
MTTLGTLNRYSWTLAVAFATSLLVGCETLEKTSTTGVTSVTPSTPGNFSSSGKNLTFNISGWADTTIGNTSSGSSLTVTNTSSSDLTIVGIGLKAGGDFRVAGTTCYMGMLLKAGKVCHAVVNFSPSASGSLSDQISIQYSGREGAGAETLTVSAKGLRPAQLAFSSAVFADTVVGTQTAASFITLTNLGQSRAEWSAPSLMSNNQFQIQGGTCGTRSFLNPAESCSLGLVFSPSTAGTRTSDLAITYSDGKSPIEARRSFSANGVSPALLSLSSVVWPAITAGASESMTVVVTNTGSATATITGKTLLTGVPFSTSGGTCSIGSNLVKDAQCTVVLTFAPLAAQTFNDQLQIRYSNGAILANATTSFSADARVPAQLSFTPASLDFGSVATGATSTLSVVVSHSGQSAAASLLGSLLAGTQFSIVSDSCTANSLMAPATCSVSLKFNPNSTGAKSDTFKINYDNGAGPTFAILALSGNATGAAAVTVAALQINQPFRSPTAWTEPNGSRIKMTFLPVTGTSVTYECRVALKSTGIANATYAPCDGSTGTQPEYAAANSLTANGTFTIEARAKSQGIYGASVRLDFYAHSELVGVQLCDLSGLAKDDDFFQAASTYLDTSTLFGNATTLVNPKIHVDYSDGGMGDTKTLRRSMKMSGDKKLILFERNYASRTSGQCSIVDHVRLNWHRSGGGWNSSTVACSTVVFNAAGDAACFDAQAKFTGYRSAFRQLLREPNSDSNIIFRTKGLVFPD